MEPEERSFLTALTLWGAAAITVFGVGLVALSEEHYGYAAFYIAVGAIGIIYIALHLRGKRLELRPGIIVVALALTWLFFGYTLWSIRGLKVVEPAEQPLPAGSARLEIWKMEPTVPKGTDQSAVNIYVINKGGAAATGMLHIGSSTITAGPVDEPAIAGMFALLRTELSFVPPTVAAGVEDLYPGQNDLWYSVPGVQVNDQIKSDLNSGKLKLYVFNLMKYRDSNLPPNKFIYTETCVYYFQAIAHLCETGHNKHYVAD